MKKSKRIISLLLSLILTLSVFNIIPSTAGAAESDIAETGATSGTTGDCTWTLDNGVLTISGNGKMGDYNSTHKNGSYVTTAPWGGYSFNTVVIESGITSIGEYAFYNCRSLTSVNIGNSVTSIGSYAFRSCTSLTSVTIPDSVTSIGSGAFNYCEGLTSVNIGNSVTSISKYAFMYCWSLTSVTIPDSVTSIGWEAFYGCSGLTSVTIGNSVTSISGEAFDYTAWYKNHPDGLVYAGKVAYGMKGSCPSEVVIKDGTASITTYAFRSCTSLTSVTIPDSVTSIGSLAFYGCTSLTSVTIPDSVTSIGNSVFSGCSSLTSVTISDSVTSIGYEAFYNCWSLTSVTIPDSVTSIGEDAFELCGGLTSVNIGNSVTSIGEDAFEGCTSLTSVTIGKSVTSIGDYALGYYSDNGYKKISGFKIYGYKDTEAEKYAKNNGFTFKAIIGKCDNCNSTLYEDDYHKGYPATCVKDGLSDGYICPSCGHKSQAVIPATGHTPGEPKQENLIKSTCTNEGSYDEVTYCTVCKAELSRTPKTIEMLAHTPVTDKAIPATCTETGLTEGSHCSVCKTVLVEQTVVPALGHKPIIDKAVEATCQHDGHTIGSYCENCGEVYVQSQVIPKLPHTPVKDEAVPATCTHTGLTEGSHCSVCGDIIVAQKVIAKLQHTAGKTVIENDVPVTCATDGSHDEVVYCTVCKNEISRKTITAKALGHTYEIVPGKPATYLRPGYADGVQCTRCGEWLLEREISSAALTGEGVFCDVDSDGKVTTNDVTFILRYLAGFDIPFNMDTAKADADGDNTLTVMDATAIQRYLVRLSSFYGIGITLPDENINRTLVNTIKLSVDSITLVRGQKPRIKADVLPADADSKALLWSSSDPSVAAVDQSGKVTAVKGGSATIYATATDGSGVYATCDITVERIEVSSITLSPSSLSIVKGQSKNLTATVAPTNAEIKALKWSSSNTSVATVDQSGKVTGVKAGTATIYAAATDGSGVKGSCSVTVESIKVSYVTLSSSSLNIVKGQSKTLTATVTPSDADNKALQWSSSNTSVATVDQSGKVTAVKGGTATIYATATDGSGVKGSCSVTVEGVKVSSVTLSSATLNLTEGQNTTLSATVTPSNADNKTLQWSSSNTSVATVDQYGKVTGVKAGTATIYATATDGSGVKGSCTVTVKVNTTLKNFNNVISYIHQHPDKTFSDGAAQIRNEKQDPEELVDIEAHDDYIYMGYHREIDNKYKVHIDIKLDFNNSYNITIHYMGFPNNNSTIPAGYYDTPVLDARNITFNSSLPFYQTYTGREPSTSEKKLIDATINLAFINWELLLLNRTKLTLKDIGFTSYNPVS